MKASAAWTLDELRALPQDEPGHAPHLHRGLERDRQVGRLTVRDVPAAHRRRHDGEIRVVSCADDYSTSIDMPTALHPQTLLALSYDGQPLPPKYGFPAEAAHADQARFQESQAHRGDDVTNTYPGGYWENQGYNWFSGS